VYPKSTIVKRAACRPLVAVLSMLVGCFVALLLLASLPPRAHASGTPMPTVSRYMSTLDSKTLYHEGCAMGNKNGIVVLDFGAPHYANGTWGTWTFGNFFASTKAIKNAAKSFLEGYWYCTSKSAPYLRLALGTSNYGNHVGSGQGRAWAKMVNDLNGWVRRRGWDAQEGVRGANDMEPSWNSPQATRRWVRAYGNAAKGKSHYYNYGSADSCPPYGNCANGWTREDVWYVSWGAPRAYPTPQIYYEANIRQWYGLAMHGHSQHGEAIRLLSTFTEHAADPSTYTSRQAWNKTNGLLNSDSRTSQTIPFSTDITWNN
jgi:hypothetical protein